VIGGLVAAVVVAGGIASCEHKRANAAEEKTARVQGQYDGYRLNQEALAEQEKQSNDRKEKTWNETNAANTGTITDLRNRLAVRVRAPAGALVRPDGSTIREAACPGPVPPGAPGQPVPAGPPEGYIPKTDYVALENRSTNDVLRLVGLQKYVTDVCLKE